MTEGTQVGLFDSSKVTNQRVDQAGLYTLAQHLFPWQYQLLLHPFPHLSSMIINAQNIQPLGILPSQLITNHFPQMIFPKNQWSMLGYYPHKLPSANFIFHTNILISTSFCFKKHTSCNSITVMHSKKHWFPTGFWFPDHNSKTTPVE